MRAIILAAGRGSRMGPLTDHQPKCLTEVYGKPLIEHQIHALAEAGIKDIDIVTGYQSEQLQDYGTHNFYNANWQQTNMVASLLCARAWLDNYDCIISYSDIYYGKQIVQDLMDSSEEIATAYDPNWLELWSKRFNDPLDDAETFRINENGYLLEIGQKPQTIEEIQGQYMGLLKFKAGVLSKYLEILSDLDIERIDMTSLLNHLTLKGKRIKTIPIYDAFFEIDAESDLNIMGIK